MTVRSRSLDRSENPIHSITLFVGGGTNTDYGVAGHEYVVTSSIVDRVAEGKVWHPVHHERREIFDSSQSIAIHRDKYSGWSKEWLGPAATLLKVPLLEELISNAERASPLDWDTCYQDLLREASGAFSASSTLAVNIAELADIKKLGLSMLKRIRSLRSILSPRRFGRYTLKELANMHLELVFGLQPLVRDTIDFFSIRQEIKRKMDRLYQMGQYEEIRTRTSSSYTIDHTGLPGYYMRTGLPVTANVSISVSSTGCLTAFCSRDLMDERSAFIRLLIGRLGLNNPALITWELIPFSFVVDWFLPVGTWIERASGSWNNYIGGVVKHRARLDRIRHGMSKTITVNVEGHLTGTDQTWALIATPMIGYGEERHSYMRGTGVPLTRPPLPPVNWSFEKTLTASALLVQQVLGGRGKSPRPLRT